MCVRSWMAAILLVAPMAAAGVVTAAPARAECVSSAGTTLCSQGDVRGADTGEGPGSLNTGGPWVPYPCENDWTCGWNTGFGIGIGFW